MSGSSSTPNVNQLFQSAQASGRITAASAATLQAVDIGAQIQAAMGTPPDAIKSSEVYNLLILVDDSSSIRFAGNTQVVRDGVNLVLDRVEKSKSVAEILVSIVYLNGGVLYPFRPIVGAPRLSASNYNPSGGTPLYDRSIETMGMILAKEQEYEDAAIPVRSSTLIVTDGHDEGSRHRASDVYPVVRDVLGAEKHIVASLGISDGVTNFMDVFSEMGLDPNWILTPDNVADEILDRFALFSKSSAMASQGAAGFSQAMGAGLKTP